MCGTAARGCKNGPREDILVKMADTTKAHEDIDEMVMQAIEADDTAGPTEDAGTALLGDEHLPDDARLARWQSRRPAIQHLEPGVVFPPGESTALPLFDVGDRVVVDCRTTLLRGNPWLETIVGRVRSIDDDTAVVSLYDEDTDARNPTVRWVSFRDPMFDLRLAPAKGNPFNAERVRAVKPPPAPGEVRRGRGRPKGSKNRPKDVIKAEKEARREATK